VTVRSAAAPPCVSTLEHWQLGPEDQQFLNIGTGVDLTIQELAEKLAGAAAGLKRPGALAAASPDILPAHVDAAFSEAVDQHVAGLFASELFNN